MDASAAETVWTAYDLPRVQPPDSERAEQAAPPAQTDEKLLSRNQSWFCSLRWLAAAGLVVLGLVALAARESAALRAFRLDSGWPLVTAGVLLVLNVSYIIIARRAEGGAPGGVVMRRIVWLQILLDLVVLTVVVHFVGSLATFAPYMYLFHIVLACIFLRPTRSLGVTLAAMGMYIACLLLEGTGLVAPASMIAGPLAVDRGALSFMQQAWYVGAVLFVSGTVWYLASRLSGDLRRRDEELSAINRRLADATDERAGHMLSTTHQLKAPFAAIHANTQLLLAGHCGPLPEEATTVVKQIAVRCEMLSRGITAMLQLANLRSTAQDPPLPVRVDLSEVIRSCLAGLRLQADRRGIVFKEELAPAPVMAVQDHAAMMLENVLSNAIHYSRDGQSVSVSSRAAPSGGAIVVVRDNGIGIMPEKLPRIFDDYFRTTEAATHNRASTGLGLAIVRQGALAGGIGVHVESAPAHGTVVTLSFPASPGPFPTPK